MSKIGKFLISTFVFLITLVMNTSPILALDEQELLNKINSERVTIGAQKLKINTKLQLSSKSKIDDMCQNKYWAHNSPNNLTPWDHIKAQGYDYEIAGENLAADFKTTEGVFLAWMKSEAHKSTMLNTRFSEIGLESTDCNISPSISSLVVVHFGRPISDEITISFDTFIESSIRSVLRSLPEYLGYAEIVDMKTSDVKKFDS